MEGADHILGDDLSTVDEVLNAFEDLLGLVVEGINELGLESCFGRVAGRALGGQIGPDLLNGLLEVGLGLLDEASGESGRSNGHCQSEDNENLHG